MIRRLGFAALAGVLVVAAFIGLAALAIRLVMSGPCEVDGFECLGQSILAIVAAVPVAALAGWLFLWWLGVRPALRVAALAPVVFGGLGWATVVGLPNVTAAPYAMVPVSYLVAAWLTAPGTSRRARVLLAAAVVVAYTVAVVLTFRPNR